MKTYNNEANTGGITKIALIFFFTFLDKVDRLDNLQTDFQCHSSMKKIVHIFLFFFIEKYQSRTPTFVKNIFR